MAYFKNPFFKKQSNLYFLSFTFYAIKVQISSHALPESSQPIGTKDRYIGEKKTVAAVLYAF